MNFKHLKETKENEIIWGFYYYSAKLGKVISKLLIIYC